ncbi:MAG TPA: hypothetical protein VI913_05545 [Candidatus Peribacteraceae bacterium]|nr:hypothetical protein [Candidatus Peribacteraceae bacterium]
MADPQQAGNPPPPPRPGDTVPVEGLDPSQVFAAPPAPPPAAPGAQGAQGDDGSAPQADQGPPPPPVGVAAVVGHGPDGKPAPAGKKGYDEEDVKILAQVGNYRFGSIAASLRNDGIVVPTHPETKFDEQMFLTLLRGSISLTRDEKWRIVQAIPKLSQFQISELQKILQEEKRKFSELSPKHLLQLQKLEQKHADDWKDLQAITAQQSARQQESAQAEEIRKQLGL